MLRTRNIALLLVSMVLPAIYCQTTDPCAPDCTNVEPGGKVPDPFACTHYYVCSIEGTPSDTSLPCEGDVFFNPVSHMCDATECIQICGKCHLTCTGAGDIVADPFDCSVFYECSIAGPGDPQTCKTPSPYFDSSNQKCSDNSSVCCRPSCNPYCDPNSSENVAVPDPTDCRNYYMCTDSPPYPHFSCGPGQVFNYGIGFCEDGGECKILCADVVDPGSTSTPVNPESTPTPVSPVTTTTPIIRTSTTTTTTTTTNATVVCVTTFECPRNGFFAKCSVCDPRYFYCSGAGVSGIEEVCTGGLVFNPIPEYPYCLRPEDCPYIPPFN